MCDFLQFLINGESSPVHQPSADFELSQSSLLPSPLCVKTEATLTPVQCNVKQEKIPIQSCGVKSIQPMPVATVPVGIQKSQLGKLNTKPAGGILFIVFTCCVFIHAHLIVGCKTKSEHGIVHRIVTKDINIFRLKHLYGIPCTFLVMISLDHCTSHVFDKGCAAKIFHLLFRVLHSGCIMYSLEFDHNIKTLNISSVNRIVTIFLVPS